MSARRVALASSGAILLRRVAAVLLCAALATGCASKNKPAAKPAATLAEPQVQSLVMSMADDLMFDAADACAQVKQRTKRPDSQLYCASVRLGTAIAAVSAATSQNPRVGAVDLLTLSTLQRMVLEEPCSRAMLDEPDRVLLHDTFARAEQDLWTKASAYVTPQEANELREMIVNWRKANPERVSVSQVRLSEFATARQASGKAEQGGEPPGSILRLMRLDPMAGLDPATRQLRESRLLAERVAFWGQRMPLILGWQMELTAGRLLDSPAATKTLQSATQFSQASDDFSSATTRIAASYERTLDVFPNERKAALDQAGGIIAQERAKALADAEAASQRLVDRFTNRLLLVVIVAAVAIACVALVYRRIATRIVIAENHPHEDTSTTAHATAAIQPARN